MNIWVDAEEFAPNGYIRANNVKQAKLLIVAALLNGDIDEININQDLSSYGHNNENAFDLLEWMIESDMHVNVRFHGKETGRSRDLQKFAFGSCVSLL